VSQFIGEKGREVVSEAEKIKTQVMSLFVLAIFLILSGMASVLGFFVAVAFGGVGFPFPSWLIVVVVRPSSWLRLAGTPVALLSLTPASPW